jgi:uncharacterized membrane protein YfcA
MLGDVRYGSISECLLDVRLPRKANIAERVIAKSALSVRAVKSEHLIEIIATLLAAIGVLVLFEVAHPFQYAQVIRAGAAFHFGVGFALGIIIRLFSSILGVAGGELPIPTMMFIFGAVVRRSG